MKKWVVSKLETPDGPEWHVLDGNDPDVVSWFCGTRDEAEAWVARKQAQRMQANANRRANNEARRDLGLTRNRDGSWE